MSKFGCIFARHVVDREEKKGGWFVGCEEFFLKHFPQKHFAYRIMCCEKHPYCTYTLLHNLLLILYFWNRSSIYTSFTFISPRDHITLALCSGSQSHAQRILVLGARLAGWCRYAISYTCTWLELEDFPSFATYRTCMYEKGVNDACLVNRERAK